MRSKDHHDAGNVFGIEGPRLPNRLQKRYQIIENRRKKICVEGEFNIRCCPHRGKPFRQRRVRSP
jgi:hypothetical protein